MALLVRPRNGLEPFNATTTSNRERLLKLYDWREAQLQRFWQQLAGALNLTSAPLLLAESKVRPLVGIGMLLVHDSVATYEQLTNLSFTEAWQDQPLPVLFVAHPLLQPLQRAKFWHLNMINKTAAYEGNAVSVGVIDYGYNPAFPDLGNINAKFVEYVDPPVNSTSLGSMMPATPTDPTINSHGSKVCVMLAGKTAGLAPKASIHFARIPLGADFYGTQVMMSVALDWLLTTSTGAHPERPIGCDIITTSIHSDGYGIKDVGTLIGPVLQEAEVWETLVVAAVGNAGGGNWQLPGAAPKVVAVGAVDEFRAVPGFSAFGKPSPLVTKPDLVAPGQGLQFPNGAGAILDWGTSYAAPLVAGAAALMLEKDSSLRADAGTFRLELKKMTSPAATTGIAAGDGVLDLSKL